MEGNLTDTLSGAVSRVCPLESHPGYRVSAFSSFFFLLLGSIHIHTWTSPLSKDTRAPSRFVL